MAQKQTRKSVSLNRDMHTAATFAARLAGVSTAQWVEDLIRAKLGNLAPPRTQHLAIDRVLKAAAAGAAARKAKQSPVRPPQPSAHALAQLLRQIERTEPGKHTETSDPRVVQAWRRRVSTRFAEELRKRGWLTPENEGYSAGSWAAA